MANKYSAIALYGILLLFGYISFLVLAPFLNYIILGFLFAFFFHPLYVFFTKKLTKQFASLAVILIVLLCIILPSVYLGVSLFEQAASAYEQIEATGISIFDQTSIANWIEARFGFNVQAEISNLFTEARDAITTALPAIITSTGAALLGLFIMFFILFYALIDGHAWTQHTLAWLPIEKEYRKKLKEKLRIETRALLYGQIVTSIFVGVVNGALLGLAGIPNPVFWGFLMVIIGIIPVVGAFLVYIPAGLYLLWQGHWIAGVLVLACCTTVHMITDYIIRPKMISHSAQIHPAFIIIGALGGIALMGVVGFLVGPLVLSFFVTLLSFDYGKK